MLILRYFIAINSDMLKISLSLQHQSINQHRKGAKFEREKQIIYITKNR